MESVERVEQSGGGAAVGEARDLVEGLRALGAVAAPPSVGRALERTLGLDDAYAPVETVLGPCFVAFNAQGVCAVWREVDENAFVLTFQARFGRPARRVAEVPAPIRRAFEPSATADRPRLRFDLRHLSEFEQRVLRQTATIPRGEVRPYSWVAREIGNPRAVRAVGTALGNNPVALLIPCHRVIRRDGHLGQYGFGVAAKQAALAAEGIDLDALAALARAGIRYLGSNTTRIFCYPTCRYARRVSDAHRVTFHSETDAAAAGYRPCKVCRPG